MHLSNAVLCRERKKSFIRSTTVRMSSTASIAVTMCSTDGRLFAMSLTFLFFTFLFSAKTSSVFTSLFSPLFSRIGFKIISTYSISVLTHKKKMSMQRHQNVTPFVVIEKERELYAHWNDAFAHRKEGLRYISLHVKWFISKDHHLQSKRRKWFSWNKNSISDGEKLKPNVWHNVQCIKWISTRMTTSTLGWKSTEGIENHIETVWESAQEEWTKHFDKQCT